MSVIRAMGTETEYAVSLRSSRRYDPVGLSFDVVGAAADPATAHIRWDYRQEDPLRDAFGHRVERAAARPEMLTDSPQLNIVNVAASNGGRIYVDHAHPEYSAPETTDPFAALRYDHAGDLLMLRAVRKAGASAGRTVDLHRNNVDGKGSSWGAHENYMMLRSVPFEQVAALMTAHFVSRQIYTGSGRVGIGERSETPGFQISQRADYLHAVRGLQTTFERPIVNTRDESHSADDYRRLHVITGDANRMDVPEVLKVGTTSMLLWLLEQASSVGFDVPGLLRDVQLADPVRAVHTVSHDLDLAAALPRQGGGETGAWQMQVRLLTAVFETAAAVYGTDSRGEPRWPDEPTLRLMRLWRQALDDLARIRHADERGRLAMHDEASRVEWLLKWQLLQRFRSKSGCNWDDPRLAAIDLGWEALDPEISVFEKMRSRCASLYTQDELGEAVTHAPRDTRAWLRAQLLTRYPSEIIAVSWTHVSVRDPRRPGAVLTLAVPDPRRGGAQECATAFERADAEHWSVQKLFRHLQALATS